MGTDEKKHQGLRLPPPLLDRRDQAAVAVLVAGGLVAIAVWLLVHGAPHGELIDVDQAPRQRLEFRIDVNQADWPELALLPGIGETLAKRIVRSREQDGPFRCHDELRRVPGIGPKTLEAIRPYLLPIQSTGARPSQ